MTTLKRHWLAIVLGLVLISALSVVIYRCAHAHAGGGGTPGAAKFDASTPSTTPAATPTLLESLLDPTTLGAIITAIASLIGLIWKSLKAKDVQGVIAAVGSGAKTYETLKDSIASGIPLAPSVETLAADITAASRNSDGPVASEARSIAIKLIEKYVITVRP